ncbi:hypothetical protein AAG570_003758, partial [Ranatra chinensis]
TFSEQQRDNERALRKASRDVDRDRRELEREEKKLEMEIKKNAQAGNKSACTVLAKQLLRVRKQKARTYTMNSKIQGVSSQNRVMGANVKMAEAMSATSKTMVNMNQIMRPEKVAGDMRNFQKEFTKMDMTEEMINDTLDDMLEESDDEAESENIVSKVLDEIGIEISGKVSMFKLYFFLRIYLCEY